MGKMKKILSVLVLFSFVTVVSAQTTILMNSSAQPHYTGCNFTIYDDGGLNGDFSPNMDVTINISSNDPNNGAVMANVDMLSFDLPCGDTLFFYDGPVAVDSMLLAYFTNCDSIGATSINVAATLRSDGSLTIRFKSDGSEQGAGFVITTECVRPCQRVQVVMDTLNCTKVPHLEADGYYYLDVCPYDNMHIAVKGVYPDNDFSYHQDDATSTFHWDFGWEAFDSVGVSEIDRFFPEGRGYDVAISITDSAGCISYVPQTFRVRTSSNPIREVLDFPQVCAGTEVDLSVGYDHLSVVQADTVGSEQITALSVNDTIFLPDGMDCGSGCAYVSPVTFTSFSPTATIQSPNDIWFVRVKMEHSFIGDIWISLTCPNGNYVSIVRKYETGSNAGCSSSIPQSEWGWLSSGSSGADFGIVGGSNGSTCDPNSNPMGTPWNYVWSNNTNNGYQYNSANYVYATSNVNNGRMDSTNVAAMTNVFHPEGSFANLIGCPMNGTWSIKVVDGWSVDNGWLTEWEIALDPALLPQDWSYQVLVDSAWVSGPGANGPQVIPDTAGNIEYTIYVMDELGCVYDTTNHMEVVGHPEPDLGEDYKICYGDISVLETNYDQAGAEGQTTVYEWNTGDNTPDIEVLTAGEYVVTVRTSSNATGLTCVGSDTINVGIYDRPVVDFEMPDLNGCAPLNLRIENHSTPEDAQFEWYLMDFDDFGNSRVAYSSTQKDPVFQLNDPGTYSLLMKMTTSDGCVDSIAYWNSIYVNPQPIAEFEADPMISMLSESGGVVNFINYADQSMVTGGQGSFYWDFGDGTIDSVNFAEPHTYTSWGDYDVTLHVESNSGCSSEITHTIVIEQDLVFPNVITPNGDGINDVFAIENLNTNVNLEDPDGYRNNRLLIHDRWGKKVYDAKNYDTYAKDGTIYPGSQIFDGTGLSDGVYYYSFQYKGKAKTVTFNGSITIVK